jgi:hypothetical protein
VPAVGWLAGHGFRQTFCPDNVAEICPDAQSVRQTPGLATQDEPEAHERHCSVPVPGLVASVPDEQLRHCPPLNVPLEHVWHW